MICEPLVDYLKALAEDAPHYASDDTTHRIINEVGKEIPDRRTVLDPAILGRPHGRQTPHIYTKKELADLVEAAAMLDVTKGCEAWWPGAFHIV